MGIFGLKLESHNQYAKEINLEKEYDFMYENFIFSTQQELYLLLEKAEFIEALKFESKIYKYGYPNDEVGLPSKISGVKYYGMSEVFNSEWIKELKINNRSHVQHNDKFYDSYRHFIVRFKDVTLEVISENYKVVKLSQEELLNLITEEILNISNVG